MQKQRREGPTILHLTSPTITSCITKVQHPNQETSTGTIHSPDSNLRQWHCSHLLKWLSNTVLPGISGLLWKMIGHSSWRYQRHGCSENSHRPSAIFSRQKPPRVGGDTGPSLSPSISLEAREMRGNQRQSQAAGLFLPRPSVDCPGPYMNITNGEEMGCEPHKKRGAEPHKKQVVWCLTCPLRKCPAVCAITVRVAWASVFSSVQWEKWQNLLHSIVKRNQWSDTSKNFGTFLACNKPTYVLDKLVIKIKMKYL